MTELYRLGASLYIPTTRDDLVEIANGYKYPALRSMIFCTEDAVGEHDLDWAITNLELKLCEFKCSGKLRFIRARNPSILSKLLSLQHISQVDGFVLPKVTRGNVDDYLPLLAGTPFKIMITLETREVFDPREMIAFRDLILERNYQQNILALRIGGNDLMKLIGIRRPRDRTIYQTPIGYVIANLVTIFKPYGFNLTAPVFEYLNEMTLLEEEIRQDLAYGLFGKTAIHPTQIPIIESFYSVRSQELDMARSLLAPGAAAVFRMHDTMCEVATHTGWAEATLRRAEIYGIGS
jgi:citrate lyase beta subunit